MIRSTLVYLSWWVGGVRWQSASWEVLPKEQSLFSLLPGQTIAIVLKLTFTSKMKTNENIHTFTH